MVSLLLDMSPCSMWVLLNPRLLIKRSPLSATPAAPARPMVRNEGAKACVPPTAQQLLHTLLGGQAYVNLRPIDVLSFRLVDEFTLFHDEKAIGDLHCETQYLLGHDQRLTPAAAPRDRKSTRL